ncbi:dual oxidase maturation factor 1-like isoform X1 [Dreissena polymorpha]|uniref:Dual oxidase maturation factor 1 n=1 Tax=Dreissena polymorpha TaxID=45954 RepID=A0A9D4RIV1_DREPO|nr:dual oxidase maturation factor 1-like isoform X1 [Dreissena polymorpha]XP_052265451.1 dual oxidase maturation factor 1-like isoform X1 [Dreissena polymorpha]XP_052265452.1 dual oxidase maturation factor 1-like isoform X1 [Dreissena polymorpha]XP_052265453.1 dual oxidase maturation factor 1-like isoform X1 [Dreissena polymorpha]XP_052265454.1 dual oxidase maturation factor 1-like isoform X1 [Dreissena polymorpha]XP_052265455.1 dual oxidase maturation factor 1-like isoform X1 [Dreissena polym
MAFQAFRTNGAPTYYDANPTPWQADVLGAGLIFAFCSVAFSLFIILPGIRGKEKIYTFIRVTVSLYIGAVIVLTNWSYSLDSWETAHIHTRTKYKAGTGKEISAVIGVYIGLRGVNITLKGTPETQLNETINYNEHFSWEWDRGCVGFGPNAGPFNQAYRAAQYRGLPLPILWIAEYFTIDGEGISWGRHYRQAGWFSHISLWLCFPLWILTNVLFFVLLKYGACCLVLTGVCMNISNFIWYKCRNVNDLKIPFVAGFMEFSFGGSFYVCLGTGILCILCGAIVWVLDHQIPNAATTFFGVDVLQDDNVTTLWYCDEPTDEKMQEKNATGIEMRPTPCVVAAPTTAEEDDDESIYAPTEAPQPPPKYENRKLLGVTVRKFQKPRRHRPPPPPPEGQDLVQDDMHVNERYAEGADEVRVNINQKSVYYGVPTDDL